MIDPTVLRTLCEVAQKMGAPVPVPATACLALLDENAALREKVAEVEKARDCVAQHHGGHLPTCGGMDSVNQRCGCGYLEGTAYRDLESRLAALKEAGNAVVEAGKCKCKDRMPCPRCHAEIVFENLLRSDP